MAKLHYLYHSSKSFHIFALVSYTTLPEMEIQIQLLIQCGVDQVVSLEWQTQIAAAHLLACHIVFMTPVDRDYR